MERELGRLQCGTGGQQTTNEWQPIRLPCQRGFEERVQLPGPILAVDQDHGGQEAKIPQTAHYEFFSS